MVVVDEVIEIFTERGAAAYFGETISISEHGLQAAHSARAASAAPCLIVAALLHDVGHLIDLVSDDLTDWRADAHHELLGGRWLAMRFPDRVSEPVRLHVPAKRYLCATSGEYFSQLSPASVITLALQGGPMSAAEMALFETEPYFNEAVQLRRWDDRAKVAGLATPPITAYRALIEELTVVAPRTVG